MNRLLHPGNLANLNGIADTDSFSYHPQTGALARARDRNGNVFTFTHAPNGELTSLRMPGAVVDSMRYDLEGRMIWRDERSPAHSSAPLQHETFVYDARGKVLAVSVPVTVDRNTSSTFVQWYSGLGSLVMTDWVNSDNPQWQRERFDTDPLGNTVMRHEARPVAEHSGNDHPDFRYLLDKQFGRVTTVELEDVEGYSEAFDVTRFQYDSAGNQLTSFQRSREGNFAPYNTVDTRSFYGADDRLRAYQKYDDRPASSQSTTNGLFEDYRYDPLGRRVAVRTRRPAELCNQPSSCYNSITYFVWAGDQLLWELRETDASAPQETRGQVSYFQAGSIDRPLTIWKQDVGSIVTHQSWRGQFARGTFGEGASRPAGQSSDCTEYPATNGCVPVRWPGWNTSAWSQEAAKPATIGSEEFWFGSLSVGMRDASGQQYMRNRYYNPQTGQFTQPDPIGIVGGFNSYGFAAGDPVSYSDPYGLSKCSWRQPIDCVRPLFGIDRESPKPKVSIGEPRVLGFEDDQGVVTLGGATTLSVATTGGTAGGGLILWSGKGPGVYNTIGYAAGLDASISAHLGGATSLSDMAGRSAFACAGASYVSACVSPTPGGGSASVGGSLGIDDLGASVAMGVSVTKTYTVGDVVQGLYDWAKPGLTAITKTLVMTLCLHVVGTAFR